MKQSLLLRVVLILAVYLGLFYFGGQIGQKILYPLRLLVTFLHELGHALGAVFTGGQVQNLQINPDGSGFAMTAGGNRSIILMGGYLGSALFGNLLFLIAARAKPLIKPTLILLVFGMVYAAVIWYTSAFASFFLIGFSVSLLLVMWLTNFEREILMFFGLASIMYIIQDFNVGPTSDLKHYADLMVIFPAQVWMYIWLIIALALFLWNIKIIMRLQKKQSANESEDFLEI